MFIKKMRHQIFNCMVSYCRTVSRSFYSFGNEGDANIYKLLTKREVKMAGYWPERGKEEITPRVGGKSG